MAHITSSFFYFCFHIFSWTSSYPKWNYVSSLYLSMWHVDTLHKLPHMHIYTVAHLFMLLWIERVYNLVNVHYKLMDIGFTLLWTLWLLWFWKPNTFLTRHSLRPLSRTLLLFVGRVSVQRRPVLIRGSRWQVGSEARIKIWEDR